MWIQSQFLHPNHSNRLQLLSHKHLNHNQRSRLLQSSRHSPNHNLNHNQNMINHIEMLNMSVCATVATG